VVQKQNLSCLDELALTPSTLSRLSREGFNSVEDLLLCSRPDLVKLLGEEMTGEIELALMREGKRLKLSRAGKLAAIRQMAVETFEEAGGQAARNYFLEALNALLEETGEQQLLWSLHGSKFFSGSCATSKDFETAINMVYMELFPKFTIPS
jgi:hypothetical protein